MIEFFFRLTGSDEDLLNTGRAGDRFADAVERPFSDNPLSNRNLGNFSKH
jgi:hypothetical protein